MRWTFGVEPLPQTVTAARLLRRVTDLVLSMEDDDGDVERLITDLRAAEARLAERAPADARPRVGPAAASPDGRVYLDHSRDIGAFNPCFPEYAIAVEGDRATGMVTFPIAFEGPPGLVHGGFLAVFFDCVMQHHNCDAGVAGKTASLSLRYRRPAPLLTELRFVLTRQVDDHRITSTGQLRAGDGGDLLCEAEMRSVAGNRATLPEVSPRRPGRDVDGDRCQDPGGTPPVSPPGPGGRSEVAGDRAPRRGVTPPKDQEAAP
jgi:acyl-coenzyme A thioesterase PaaI-like protein